MATSLQGSDSGTAGPSLLVRSDSFVRIQDRSIVFATNRGLLNPFTTRLGRLADSRGAAAPGWCVWYGLGGQSPLQTRHPVLHDRHRAGPGIFRNERKPLLPIGHRVDSNKA